MKIVKIKSEWFEGNNAIIKNEVPPEDSDEELPTATTRRTIICTESEFEFEGNEILESEIEFEETKLLPDSSQTKQQCPVI